MIAATSARAAARLAAPPARRPGLLPADTARPTRLPAPPRADPANSNNAQSRTRSSLEDAVRAASAAAEEGHRSVDDAAAGAAAKAKAAAAKAEAWFGRGKAGDATKTKQARQGRGVFAGPPRTPARGGGGAGASRARGLAKLAFYAAAAYAAASLLAAVSRVLRAQQSESAVRARTVDKNRAVVDAIAAALDAGGLGGGRDGGPSASAGLTDAAAGLTPALVRKLAARTGFTPAEIFRKWLWYALRERRFDEGCVADLVGLKGAAGLTDADVASALAERAARIYARYGNIMLETEGMTKAGIERKATARALFSKLLYLAECEAVLDPASDAGRALDVAGIFGATEEDAAKLRLISLVEVDLDKLEGQFGGGGSVGGEGGWGGLAA